MTAEVTKSYSILITDDDRDYREALRELVEPEGYKTVLASSGEEALDILREEPIHLALFDMHMPRLTGLEAFAMIRQALDRILPAVLMTADANNELIRQAFAAQVYSVIPKPVSANVVGSARLLPSFFQTAADADAGPARTATTTSAARAAGSNFLHFVMVPP